MSKVKSELYKAIEMAITNLEKATTDVHKLAVEYRDKQLHAPAAALKAIWFLKIAIKEQRNQVRYNMLVNDCFQIADKYREVGDTFIRAYLSLFFPRAFMPIHTLGNLPYKTDGSRHTLWASRPTYSRKTESHVLLHQSYRRFVLTATGFIYGDATADYSNLLRPVYETIVNFDRNTVHSLEVYYANGKQTGEGLPRLDDSWIKAVLGQRQPQRLNQVVDIPGDIYKHIFPIVPPFVSVSKERDEFQLYKTTYQICTYNAVDWPAPDAEDIDTVGEEVRRRSCIFSL